MGLDGMHHPDGDGQYDDFIYRLEHHLPQHELRQFVSRHHPAECQREEYHRIDALSGHRAENGAGREIAPLGSNLHAAHHIGIHERPAKEGHESRTRLPRPRRRSSSQNRAISTGAPCHSPTLRTHSRWWCSSRERQWVRPSARWRGAPDDQRKKVLPEFALFRAR